MKFSYTALTKDNKKITGVLDVESQEAAQAELHKMGVAIISVNEISEEDYEKLKKEQKVVREKKGIRTFNFLGIDPNKKEVEGTIDAIDNFSAYKRLRTEYKFEVKELHPTEAAGAEKEAAKGLLLGFEARLEQDLAASGGEAKEDEKEAGEEMNKEIIAEVDRVIVNTKKTIEQYKALYSNELLAEISNTLDELERIRTSNNIKHITEVSNDLYSLISNPDKGGEKEVGDKEYQSLMGEIKESALVKKEFELYKKAIRLSGAKKMLEGIAKRLKQLTETSDEEGKKAGLITRIKSKIHASLEKMTKKKKAKAIIKKGKKIKGRLGAFLDKLSSYSKTTSPVLKKTRKRELIQAFKALFRKKKKAGEEKKEAEKPKEAEKKEMAATETKGGKKHDFTKIFVEIDSFIGWLLCFYIIYFFLVNFSLEKNIGLSSEFVFKTLKTPLLLNITIFLLMIHFTLRIKNLHFRQNALAAFFLIALSLGIYTLLIANF